MIYPKGSPGQGRWWAETDATNHFLHIFSTPLATASCLHTLSITITTFSLSPNSYSSTTERCMYALHPHWLSRAELELGLWTQAELLIVSVYHGYFTCIVSHMQLVNMAVTLRCHTSCKDKMMAAKSLSSWRQPLTAPAATAAMKLRVEGVRGEQRLIVNSYGPMQLLSIPLDLNTQVTHTRNKSFITTSREAKWMNSWVYNTCGTLVPTSSFNKTFSVVSSYY